MATRDFFSSESLTIPAKGLLKEHPEIAPIMLEYFRKTPDEHDMKEFLGTLIVFYDKIPYKDVFDYVAKCDPLILKDVYTDEELRHYKEAFFT